MKINHWETLAGLLGVIVGILILLGGYFDTQLNNCRNDLNDQQQELIRINTEYQNLISNSNFYAVMYETENIRNNTAEVNSLKNMYTRTIKPMTEMQGNIKNIQQNVTLKRDECKNLSSRPNSLLFWQFMLYLALVCIFIIILKKHRYKT